MSEPIPTTPHFMSPYLTREQAAEYLTISVRLLTNLVASRKLRPGRIGRRLVFKRAELDRFMDLQMALAS